MDDIAQGSGLQAEEATQGDYDMAPIQKIGIIGAGQMGSGIAHVVALSGYDVVLHDIVKERVDAALEIIDKNLARQVTSGKISEEERQKALSRITYADTLGGFADADLVIEAATEDETVKRKIFVALCPCIKPDAIDTAMRLGAHHPMGPLQLADFIGLDTCLSIMQGLYEGLADSKYRPCPLLVKYVEAGWLGRKTKRGFYDYRGETPMPTR